MKQLAGAVKTCRCVQTFFQHLDRSGHGALGLDQWVEELSRGALLSG